jgi:4-amino-4-deoxy-L-arabinose transferase-like glycosyltransferase
MLYKKCQHSVAPFSKHLTLTAILSVALALRVVYLAADRFHADEALYAGWALHILDGDLFLLTVPVDKPPLYLYALAASMRLFGRSEVSARLPNLAASLLGIALMYRLGRRLYGSKTALGAALFVALSPYDILFARTAFTDPILVLWMLTALCAVAAGRWFWAGVTMGLAFATKQHAVALVPLVLVVGWVQAARSNPMPRQALRTFSLDLLASLLGFSIPFALVTWWDAQRWAVRPGYWRQSAMSYGGLLWATPAEWGERLVAWVRWARYLVGSPLLYVLLAIGGGALLAHRWRHQSGERQTRLDTALAGYGLGYVFFHTIVQFSVWDRYLLPLVPVVGLILGRIVMHRWKPLPRKARALRGSPAKDDPWEQPARAVDCPQDTLTGDYPLQAQTAARGYKPRLRDVWTVVVCMAALFSGIKAAFNGYPIGGEHWAYQGLDQVVAYLIENASSDAVLYHHWLRWHYTFYLHGTDFELRWWESGEHLRREATRTPDREQYIVLPDWRTIEPEAEGITFDPIYEAHHNDGSISLTLYRITCR